MRSVAVFAASDSGRAYANVCRTWGIDPGAALSDDVLAYNLRAAFTLQDDQEPPSEGEPTDTDQAWEQAAAENRRIWETGA